MRLLSRVILGTAQLGMDYGIANRAGAPEPKTVSAILDAAWAGGVTCFDTARHYGSAEASIGRWMKVAGEQPAIVSKFPSFAGLGDDEAEIRLADDLEASLAALGVSSLDFYLAHDAADIQRPPIVSALRAYRERGRIGAFGVSGYTPDDIDVALRVEGLEMVQVPASFLDRRVIASGVMARCAEQGVYVVGRSIFLQGLIFMDPVSLPPHFAPARERLLEFRGLAAEAGVSLPALALATAVDVAEINSVVIGVTGPTELEEILAAAATSVPTDAMEAACRLGAGLSVDILDPRRWP